MARWGWIALALVFSGLAGAPPAHAEKRIALLIGNKDYKSGVGALANPLNDVRIVGDALGAVGFEVLKAVHNARRADMLLAIHDFAAKLEAAGPDAVGFLYYSGHGIASAGENYLIPVDVDEPSTRLLSVAGVKQSEVLAILRNEAPNAAHYLVLDACRNTLQGARGGKGFVPVGQQSGVLIAFAAEPGKTASDTGQGSGPYAAALAAELIKPGQSDLIMFHNVRVAVIQQTGGDQVPWTEDGIQRPQRILFGGAPKLPPAAGSSAQPGIGLDNLMAACVKDLVHPNAAAIAARLAAQLQGGRFQYVWHDEASGRSATGTPNESAKAVVAVTSTDDELRIVYDWQHGSLRLRPVAPLAIATRGLRPPGGAGPAGSPGTRLQGIWLQDNGFGCVQLHFSPTGEASGMWGIRTDRLDAKVFVRRQSDVALAAPPTKRPTFTPSRPAQPAAPVAPARCDGVETLVANETRCLKQGDSFRDCPECPEMVVVPAGEFMMGSPESEAARGADEGPQRKVTISKPFAVGKVELRAGEWEACVFDGGCKHYPPMSDKKLPVTNVSWDHITKEYLPWLSRKTGKDYRLLTEAEWEYAARAGTMTPFSTGPTITTDQANFDGNYTYGGSAKGQYRQKGQFRQKPVEVGSFKPNAFGLYDMHGNVWEWVQDCYKASYAGAPSDGSAVSDVPGCRRVLRGGSWSFSPRHLRSAVRYSHTPDGRGDSYGFRVARTLDP